MKRSFSIADLPTIGLVLSGSGLIAATYGLVRLAYGLFLPDVQRALGLDDTAAGLISTGASLVYCIGAAIGFFSADRIARGLVVAAMLSASAGTAGMAASSDVNAFALFAILGSAGAGLASPALVIIVRRSVSSGSEARHQTAVNSGTGPGLVLAGLLALALLPDWRSAWSIVSGITLAAGAAVLLTDRGARRPMMEDDSTDRRPPRASWIRAHGWIVPSALLLGAGSAAVWNYGRSILVASGASDIGSITAWIALGIGGTAAIPTARLLTGLRPVIAWGITVLAVAAATCALPATPTSVPIALLVCAVFGWGYTAATGVLITWTAGIDPHRSSSGASALFIVLVLGQGLGASLLGMLSTSAGTTTAFLVAAAVTACAALIPLGERWSSRG